MNDFDRRALLRLGLAGGGIAALPIWLIYLRELVRDFRSAPHPEA